MKFKLPLLLSLLLPILALAQDFASLSPKERIAAAEREEVEAAQDASYMQMMQQGHELFKKRHYLKAIHKYEDARTQRPLNVYPKVIIADIELSMKDTLTTLRAVEKLELEKPQLPEPPKADTEKVAEPKPIDIPKETPKQRLEKVEKWEAEERRKLEQARQQQNETKPAVAETAKGDVPKMSVADYQKELAQKYPKGITEEISTEGNKTITKRIVVSGETGNEYKKVVHNWGGVFFFKNGESVTERVWNQETQ